MRRCENIKLEYWDYYEDFLPNAIDYIEDLMNLPLKQWEFKLPDGSSVPSPRLSVFYKTTDINNVPTFEEPIIQTLASYTMDKMNQLGIRDKDGKVVVFTAALVHLYRDGKDHIGWHSDREADDTFVVGLSFGAQRKFKIRRIGQKQGWLWEAMLKPGSCLVQYPGMQQHCQHMIMKTTAKTQPGPRISITFRQRQYEY